MTQASKLLALVTMLGSAAAPLVARACECDVIVDGASAEIVFVGAVVAQSEWVPPRADDMLLRTFRYTFAVDKSLKGPKMREVVVDTYTHLCGYPFKVHGRYTVYAKALPDNGIQWFTSRCSKTSRVRRQ